MKKRNSLLAIAMMLSASGFAQTTLWDGETSELDSRGGCWDDGEPTVVVNPETDGINTSAKCLKFTMKKAYTEGEGENQVTRDGAKTVKIPFRDWTKPSMGGSYRVSLMIKKSVNENLQIELSDPTNGTEENEVEPYYQKVAAWYGGDGKWQKVVFDFSTNGEFDYPGVISIIAQTATVTEDQDVYIDNVVIEPATKVDGVLLSDIADGTLTGDLTLTGAWMKGDCQNANGDWSANNYNDFATLAKKLSKDVTSIDLRGTVLKDVDYEAFYKVSAKVEDSEDTYTYAPNPNLIVYTDEAAPEEKAIDNVVYSNGASKLVLSNEYAFSAPVGFEAAEVKVYRSLYEGYNTVYLPFAVSQEELGAESMAKYFNYTDETDGMVVRFTTVNGADANTPVLVKMAAAAEGDEEQTELASEEGDDADGEGNDEGNNEGTEGDEGTETSPAEETPSLTFYNKVVTALGENASSAAFKGTYAPMSGEGKWGISTDDSFQLGAEGSTFKAFTAYLELPEADGAKAVRFYVSDGETNGISSTVSETAAATDRVYTLSGVQAGSLSDLQAGRLAKGLYIVNGKKVVVK